MTDYCPKAFCLSYTDIINNALLQFFIDFNDSFSKQNEKYVISRSFSIKQLTEIFKELILNEINRNLNKINEDKSNVKHIYLIGTCKQNDNVFCLNNSDVFSFSYKILEDDIYIDIIKFEKIFDKIFNQYFKVKNLSFTVLKHKNLSFDHILNIIKSKYGENRCINIVNVDKYIIYDINSDLNYNRSDIVKLSDLLNFYLTEVNQFLKISTSKTS